MITPYTELRNQPRRPLIEQLPLPGPLAVYIEITNSCNLNCGFCPRSRPDYYERVGGETNMPYLVFLHLVNELAKSGLRVARLYGIGEPFLHQELRRYVKACSSLGLRTEVTTNGVLLSPCKLQDMADAKLTYLRISDYGSVRTPNSVYALLTEFRKWRDSHNLGPRIIVKTFSATRLETIRESFPDAADDWTHEESLHNWAGAIGEGLADKTRRVCPSPFFLAQIKANGDVMPCCACAFHNKLGNIHHQSFAEIWKGRTAEAFRKMQIDGGRFENEGCRNCSYPSTLPDNLDKLQELP